MFMGVKKANEVKKETINKVNVDMPKETPKPEPTPAPAEAAPAAPATSTPVVTPEARDAMAEQVKETHKTKKNRQEDKKE